MGAKGEGKGRVMGCELMIPNPAIRNLIREEKVHHLYSQMQVGQQKFGMVTLSQSLLDLVSRNLISPETALEAATEPEELKQMLGMGQSRLPQAGRVSLAK